MKTKQNKKTQGHGNVINVQYGNHGQSCCVANLKVAKKVNFKSSHHKKNNLVILYGDRG